MGKRIAVVSVLLLLGAIYFAYAQSQSAVDSATREVNRSFREEAEEKIEKVKIRKDNGDIDLSNVPDGVYEGEHPDIDGSMMKVKVTVESHVIIDIQISGKDDVYTERASVVADAVVEQQSIKVDTVTGATVSSKAILGAIKDALEKDER